MTAALTIVYAGTPDFAVPALEALLASGHRVCAVYTQPDRPAGRGRQLQASPVKQVAQAAQVPVYQPHTLKSAEVEQQLSRLAPDVMVVAAYGLLLPAAILRIPRYGCINIHASLLPRWRGAAPIQRAIQAGDQQTGITIMQMDAGLDTGGMLRQAACHIGPTDTAGMLHDRLACLGAQALMTVLATYAASGGITALAQQEALATYAGKLNKSEAKIDWHEPAQALERKIRAFNPWPVAQTIWQGQPLRIWLAECVTGVASDTAPGTVIRTGPMGIDVATGDGVLRLQQVQLPGKRPMVAKDFLNAHALQGVKFGY